MAATGQQSIPTCHLAYAAYGDLLGQTFPPKFLPLTKAAAVPPASKMAASCWTAASSGSSVPLLTQYTATAAAARGTATRTPRELAHRPATTTSTVAHTTQERPAPSAPGWSCPASALSPPVSAALLLCWRPCPLRLRCSASTVALRALRRMDSCCCSWARTSSCVLALLEMRCWRQGACLLLQALNSSRAPDSRHARQAPSRCLTPCRHQGNNITANTQCKVLQACNLVGSNRAHTASSPEVRPIQSEVRARHGWPSCC